VVSDGEKLTARVDVGLNVSNVETWAEGFPVAMGEGLRIEGEFDSSADGSSLTAMLGLAEVDGVFEGEFDSIADGSSLTAMLGLTEVDGVFEGELDSIADGGSLAVMLGLAEVDGVSLPRRNDGEEEGLLLSATDGEEEGPLLSAALGISVTSGRMSSSSVVQSPQVRGHFCRTLWSPSFCAQ